MENPEQPKVSLSTYLSQNSDILSILGVFVAIMGLSGNLSIKLIAVFVSFFAFTCATIILIEFWRRPIDGKVSFRLRSFRVALSLLALSFFLYWFCIVDAAFPTLIGPVLAILFTEGWVGGVSLLEKKIAWIKKVREKVWANKLMNTAYALAVTFIVLYLAAKIASMIEFPIFNAVVWVINTSANLKGAIQ